MIALAPALSLLLLAVAPAAPITLRVAPDPVWIGDTPSGQTLAADFFVTNGSAETQELTRIALTVRDADGRLVLRKEINGNGTGPSIATIPNRSFAPNDSHLIFNPFHTFPAGMPLDQVRIEMTLHGASGDSEVAVDFAPRPYRQRVRLRMPLNGTVLNWDGHDLLAHHRRWDVSHPVFQKLGIRTNPGRYAYDFVPVNAEGAMGNGDNANNTSWIGFGMPVHAPAAGRVCAARDTVDDDRTYDSDSYTQNPNGVFGNYVIIDHGNGEFSQLGHLQRGRVSVHVGDQVESGQVVGAVGASGSAMFPHLHYQLTNSCDQSGEGLPSRFSRFERVQGRKHVPVDSGGIDTGELVRAR